MPTWCSQSEVSKDFFFHWRQRYHEHTLFMLLVCSEPLIKGSNSLPVLPFRCGLCSLGISFNLSKNLGWRVGWGVEECESISILRERICQSCVLLNCNWALDKKQPCIRHHLHLHFGSTWESAIVFDCCESVF